MTVWLYCLLCLACLDKAGFVSPLKLFIAVIYAEKVSTLDSSCVGPVYLNRYTCQVRCLWPLVLIRIAVLCLFPFVPSAYLAYLLVLGSVSMYLRLSHFRLSSHILTHLLLLTYQWFNFANCLPPNLSPAFLSRLRQFVLNFYVVTAWPAP